MAISLGDITLFFKGDTSGVEAASTKVQQGIDRLNSAVESRLKAIGDAAQKMGMAFAGIGTAIIAPLGLAVKSAAEFGKGLAEIASLGVKNMGSIEAAIKSVVTTFGVDLKDATNAAYQALSSGVPEENIASFLEEAAKAATAGMTDLSTTIEVGASMVNVFGGNVKDLFDQAFVAVKDGVLRFEDLKGSIGRLAPTFQATGLSSKEMFASVAALTTQGIKCDEAITGMKAVLTNVIKPSKEAGDMAQYLGIKFDAQALKAQGLQVFLQGVSKATGGNITTMGQLFGSVEALNAVMALTGSGGGQKLDQVLKDMSTGGHACAEAFDLIVKNDPTMALKILKGEMQVMAVEIGQALLPALKGVTDFLKPIVEGIRDFAQQHPDTMKMIVEIAAIVGGTSLAMGGLLLTIKPLITAFLALRTAMMFLTGAGAMSAAAATATATGAAAAGASVGLGAMAASAAALLLPIAAVAAAVALVAPIILKDIALWQQWTEAARQKEEGDKRVAAGIDAYAQKLEAQGAAIDGNVMKTMDANGQIQYLNAQRIDSEQQVTEALIANLTERDATAAEVNTAEFMRLNMGMDRKSAALASTIDLSNQEYQDLLRMDGAKKQSFEQFVAGLDNTQMTTAEKTAAIRAEFNKLTLNDTSQGPSVNEQMVASLDQAEQAQAAFADRSKGFWGGLADYIYSSMGQAWEWVKGLFSSTPTIPIEAMAFGGRTQSATILAGEEGPELATTPTGQRFILPAKALYTVPVGTFINTAAETVNLLASRFAGAFAAGGIVPDPVDMFFFLDKFTKMINAALNQRKITRDVWSAAVRYLNQGVDPNTITSLEKRNGKIAGLRAKSAGAHDNLYYSLRPQRHGGLMQYDEASRNSRFMLMTQNIQGFARGGTVTAAASAGQVVNVNLTMPGMVIRESADISRFADAVSKAIAAKIQRPLGGAYV